MIVESGKKGRKVRQKRQPIHPMRMLGNHAVAFWSLFFWVVFWGDKDENVQDE
jgi:hypothetical protein